jgi:non-heme chloroperoxidase
MVIHRRVARASRLFHRQLTPERHMNPSGIAPPSTATPDEDLAEQANPGHGIPSQDPSPAAQTALEPVEAEREVNSVLIGGGMVVGAATGAAIGTAMAGPVGAVVGGTLGAVAGHWVALPLEPR